MNIIKCKICGKPGAYNAHYDAFHCPTCNVWLEDVCDNPECAYCTNRPEVPNEK